MKKYTKEIEVYELGEQYDGFCVEVHSNETKKELYLYHNQYGIKMYMLSVAITSGDFELQFSIDIFLEQFVKIYTDSFKPKKSTNG